MQNINFSQALTVELNSEDMKKIDFYTDWKSKTLKLESYQQHDLKSTNARFRNGAIAELAIAKLLGVDWYYGYFGGSSFNNYPDMSYYGYNLGIKSSKISGAPKINKNLKENQIICLIESSLSYAVVHIMGICNQEIISKYGDDSIVTGDLRLKEKTGFLAFDKLLPFIPAELQFHYGLKITQIRTVLSSLSDCLYMECVTPELLSFVKITNGVISKNPIVLDLSNNYNNQYFLDILNIINTVPIVGLGVLAGMQSIKLYNEKYFEHSFSIQYIDIFEELLKSKPNLAVFFDKNACYDSTFVIKNSLSYLCDNNNLDYLKGIPSNIPLISLNAYKCQLIYKLMLDKGVIKC